MSNIEIVKILSLSNSMGMLNFEEAISVSLWFKTPLAANKEQFLISHGSWQNRWKLSITPADKIRWTINSNTGIVDLDNNFNLIPDKFYHIVATYDGATLLLFIDGVLNSFIGHSGSIKTTEFDMLIGQMLPGQSNYNLKGVIDDVIVFDYALNREDVNVLFVQGTTSLPQLENDYTISVYPNPVIDIINLSIPIEFDKDKILTISILDISGREVLKFIRDTDQPSINVRTLQPGLYFLMIKSQDGEKIKGIKFLKS